MGEDLFFPRKLIINNFHMCRMIALLGPADSSLKENVLNEMGRLATEGVVPVGVKPGHHDGWGVAAFRQGKMVLIEKSVSSASSDEKFRELTGQIASTEIDLLVGHLRKASVGSVKIENVHPFVRDSLVFCHNGRIVDSGNIPVKDISSLHGSTDSERLFAYLAERLVNISEASSLVIEQLNSIVSEFGVKHKFTSLNFILTNGKQIWARREVDEKNSDVQKMKLMDYYTLFIGTSIKHEDIKIISSEPLRLPDFQWSVVKNHQTIDFKI